MNHQDEGREWVKAAEEASADSDLTLLGIGHLLIAQNEVLCEIREAIRNLEKTLR